MQPAQLVVRCRRAIGDRCSCCRTIRGPVQGTFPILGVTVSSDQQKSRFVASITSQSEDFPGWYNDVVLKAQLADYSPVRGCMVIRPYGYAIWESMRDELDRHIKRTGHENVYFPLFVPTLAAREGSRARRGLQPAGRVGHARRRRGAQRVAGDPADQRGDHRREGQGLGPVVPRPAAAVQPVEQRRPLGAAHTPLPAHRRVPVAGGAHLPRHGAGSRRRGRDWPRGYRATAEDWLAIPVIKASKTENETFPGAVYSRRDRGDDARRQGAAGGHEPHARPELRQGGRHRVPGRDNKLKNPYGTSWGFSTRMVGATIMAHGDDSGLVLPPNVAPTSW